MGLTMGRWYNNSYNEGVWWRDIFFDSREDAIKDGVQQYKDALNGKGTDLFDDSYPNEPTGIFYIAEAIEFVPSVDVDRIIDSAAEQAWDECGEAGEDYLYYKDIDKHIPELEDELQAVFDKWLDKYQSKIYHFETIEKIDANDYI